MALAVRRLTGGATRDGMAARGSRRECRTHRVMYTNVSDAQPGHDCASWTSSQFRQSRAVVSCTVLSGTPADGLLVERREAVDASRERHRVRPAEAGAVVDIVLRRSVSPPDVTGLAPPQFNDVSVQHGLAVVLQRSVTGPAQRRGSRRCTRHARDIRSHADG